MIAGTAIVILSPTFLILTALISLDGGWPFFTQKRVGQNGRLFDCYKFRSMYVDAEQLLTDYLATHPGAAAEWRQFQKLKQDIRVTKIGRLLRRSSLDELPQLINIMRGDMSLVGPRPILPQQIELYADTLHLYQQMRPGLTGLWQIGGRSQLTFQQRVALDATYVRRWSLGSDVMILLKTVPTLLQPDRAF